MGVNALPGHPYFGMVFLTRVANSTTTPPMLVGRSMSDWKRTFSAALDVFLLVSLGAGLALVSAWLIDVVLLTDIADYLTSSSGAPAGGPRLSTWSCVPTACRSYPKDGFAGGCS
jgi:hypothetical protein